MFYVDTTSATAMYVFSTQRAEMQRPCKIDDVYDFLSSTSIHVWLIISSQLVRRTQSMRCLVTSQGLRAFEDLGVHRVILRSHCIKHRHPIA
jgi:hypothetical protein